MTKFLSTILIFFTFFTSYTHAQNGDVLGHTLFSDIGAYINNYPIQSYIFNDKTIVFAKDLASYGFFVSWDEESRCTSITRNLFGTITPQEKVYKNSLRAGMPDKSVLSTDITAKIDGRIFPCANIDGHTVIYFDDLAAFGNLLWDSENRAIKLTISGLPYTKYAPIPENPDITLLYTYGGKTYVAENDEVESLLSAGWFLEPPKKAIALTFDDGPSIYTPQILDTLAENGVKATFFVVGNRIEKHSDILLKTYNLGMEIGNHSWDHSNLTRLSMENIVQQRELTDNAVSAVTGHTTSLMRPPYGSRNDLVMGAFNMPAILWSLDTLDWKSRDALTIVDTVLSTAKDGDIILMHDLYQSTADAVDILVPRLISEGYEIVTVSQLARMRGSELSVKSYSQFR